MEKSAIFSEDRKYRYVLQRTWGKNKDNYCMFICLNPSVADEFIDDNTVRRCINYSKNWGFDSLTMANIFAWRETKSELMLLEKEPIGYENDKYLLEYAKNASIVIAAWGNRGKHLNRGEYVKNMIPNLYCLKISKGGNPWHPLYLRKYLKPIKYE
jgi:hypothetical protein